MAAAAKSDAVHPDHQTRVAGGWMYAFAMSGMLFLAAQVWNMNGNVSRMVAKWEAQQHWNVRMERTMERFGVKLDKLAEHQNHEGD